MRSPLLARTALLAAGLLLAVAGAGAHPQHTAVGDRYVKLVAEEGRLRVVYSVSYGPIGAARARQAMDVNHDGRLTARETKAAARALGARIGRRAHLSVDGERQPIAHRAHRG